MQCYSKEPGGGGGGGLYGGCGGGGGAGGGRTSRLPCWTNPFTLQHFWPVWNTSSIDVVAETSNVLPTMVMLEIVIGAS